MLSLSIAVSVDEFYEISNKIPLVYLALNNRSASTHGDCQLACLERVSLGQECYGAVIDSDGACLLNHQ